MCPISVTECFETTPKEVARHQTDIGQNLLQVQLEDGKLSPATNTQKADTAQILFSNKVFDDAHDDTPPAQWTSKLRGRAVTFSESIHRRHQMAGDIITPTKDYRFVQWNKSTQISHPHPTIRAACVPKSAPHCSKGVIKTTENINHTPKFNDTKSDVIASIFPVCTKNTPPSAGDTREREVTSQDPVPRQSSTSRGRGGRKEGTTDKPKTMGQSGDHRQAVYAFAEAFPPAARKLNIQSLGRSEKCWGELKATVRCCRLKEERFIMRLLKLERLQSQTIEAERKGTNSANAIKRPKSNGALEAHSRQSSEQTAAVGGRTSVARSRPASAYSCRDATHPRKVALVDADGRKGAADAHARSNELNTGRAMALSLRGVPTRSNIRYAWLSP